MKIHDTPTSNDRWKTRKIHGNEKRNRMIDVEGGWQECRRRTNKAVYTAGPVMQLCMGSESIWISYSCTLTRKRCLDEGVCCLGKNETVTYVVCRAGSQNRQLCLALKNCWEKNSNQQKRQNLKV